MIIFKFIIDYFIATKDRAVGIYRDIRNYFFIWNIIKKNRNTDAWKDLSLRHDNIGRIYTVINLRQEDFGEKAEDMKQFKFMEIAMPIFTYLNDLGLQEVIAPTHKHIEGTISYLVTFTPIFKWLELGWIIGKIIKITILILFIHFINNLFNFSVLFDSIFNYFFNN